MACTTILVGKKATYDGSTMIARNDDSGAGHFTPKRLTVVTPRQQPRHYRSVISHVEIDLPDDPLRYSAVPNALPGEGIWAAAGINAAHVAMTATETIASNERVLGADPLVVRQPAADGQPEIPGGIGEEDIVTLVLPYIRSAKEGVFRLAALLERYGTYEMNGIAFSDRNEIWWMETLGGHHWIAKRVPDDRYVVMPNQSGIDSFDLEDALGTGVNHLCSKDLRTFMEDNHLDLTLPADEDGQGAGGDGDGAGGSKAVFNPRPAFGTQDDADRVYNTPRAWYMLRYFNPRTYKWDGPDAAFGPCDNDLPWSLVPERKITVEDVKYILSSHFQGTPYDPYGVVGDPSMRGAFRSIGVNRTDFLALLQLRPEVPDEIAGVEWLTFGSNVFNTFVPFYPETEKVPAYLSHTEKEVDTDSYYWSCRLIAALADASYKASKIHIERYQQKVMADAHRILREYDGRITAALLPADEAGKRAAQELLEAANEELAAMLRHNTADVLSRVLNEASNQMKNAYARSDA